MKYNGNARIIAALLALLLMMTGVANAVEAENGALEDGAELVIEDGNLELPVEIADLDLAGELDGFSADLATDNPSKETPSDTEIKSEDGETTYLELGVGEKYTIDVEAIGSGKKVKLKSSKTGVATVTSKGVVKGVKKGKATITCTVGGKEVARFEVQVVPAPKKVTLNQSSVILGVKQTFTLVPSVPTGTHASFTWSVKDKAIATVSTAGVVTGKKVGKTTVTVKTHNGKTAKATVEVRKAPGKVTLDKTSATLKVSETVILKATLLANTYSQITWSSSDTGVATVNDVGTVTAVGTGKATITAKTFNGRKATCKVTVKPDTEAVNYRALLIGEENFYDDNCTRNRGDVYHMSNMLLYVRGLHGGRFSITEKYDLSAEGVLKAIKTTFADADENDVSLFFIATHGDVGETGEEAGYLSMAPYGMLLLGELADALRAVPGKVIVILESCGAGAAIYANNGSRGGQSSSREKFEALKKRAEAFDAAAIRVFSNADTGVETSLRANTGEFRVENKFYVLTAARYQELSWGMEYHDAYRSYNYFTLWLTQGIGTTGSMPADTNNNGQTTLDELYRYISSVGDDYPISDKSGVYYQHVQVYPAKSNFVLFCR